MTPVEFLSVALSFVLGLAVAVLLTALLDAFRARRRTRASWLPLTWAFYVLVIQFDDWWEIFSLVSTERWTAGGFVFLSLIALLLFAAGGLILRARLSDYIAATRRLENPRPIQFGPGAVSFTTQ